MKPVGLTRVRNESLIIEDTVRHFLQYCDRVILYDDCSEDDTVDRAWKAGGCNIDIIEGDFWSANRMHEETRHRSLLLQEAVRTGAEWALYFDADERLVLPAVMPSYLEMLLDPLHTGAPFPKGDAYQFRLFDGYLADGWQQRYHSGERLKDLPRLWGPEYRDIVFLFKTDCAVYRGLDQRAPIVTGHTRLAPVFVKHFGKCLSVEHWEETCRYYATYFPSHYSVKWSERMGQAIHEYSDFGRPLFTWDELMQWNAVWRKL